MASTEFDILFNVELEYLKMIPLKIWISAMVLVLDGNSEIGAHVSIFAELRVMGGSEVLMAPQFGNKHGTLAIEPVSTRLGTD